MYGGSCPSRNASIRAKLATKLCARSAKGTLPLTISKATRWRITAASSLGVQPAPDEPLEFMVVEDFGTRGLQGDPRQSEDEEIDSTGPRNDFYYFWRNIGRSRKQASELRRWGLGKTVFPAASRINSFFAITTRVDDQRRFMMGQSVLKIHKTGGKRFYPYGYYGQFEGDFAVPVDDRALIDQFCREFQLARGRSAWAVGRGALSRSRTDTGRDRTVDRAPLFPADNQGRSGCRGSARRKDQHIGCRCLAQAPGAG